MNGIIVTVILYPSTYIYVRAIKCPIRYSYSKK